MHPEGESLVHAYSPQTSAEPGGPGWVVKKNGVSMGVGASLVHLYLSTIHLVLGELKGLMSEGVTGHGNRMW